MCIVSVELVSRRGFKFGLDCFLPAACACCVHCGTGAGRLSNGSSMFIKKTDEVCLGADVGSFGSASATCTGEALRGPAWRPQPLSSSFRPLKRAQERKDEMTPAEPAKRGGVRRIHVATSFAISGFTVSMIAMAVTSAALGFAVRHVLS